jgi:hypothetical protein
VLLPLPDHTLWVGTHAGLQRRGKIISNSFSRAQLCLGEVLRYERRLHGASPGARRPKARSLTYAGLDPGNCQLQFAQLEQTGSPPPRWPGCSSVFWLRSWFLALSACALARLGLRSVQIRRNPGAQPYRRRQLLAVARLAPLAELSLGARSMIPI